MSQPRRQKKDRTSLVIAVILHVVVIGAVGWWMARTGRLEKLANAVLQYVRSEKKDTQKTEQKPVQTKTQPSKLPPINQGMAPPSSGGGTRRAVAADAPAAAGETFFQDTRSQTSGPSVGGGGPAATAKTNAPQARAERPRPAAPRPMLSTAPPSTLKQLLVERSKAVASIEAIGSEQMSKSGSSDAGGAVTKVAGTTVSEGKYPVIRGLNERYVSTTLNGASLPSADPYRQTAPLDLFPAQVIDRVVVAKTYTPDQPGSATGGSIEVFTKSFPEKPFFALSLGGEYNSQATGNDKFLTYKGGGLDWAAMDDGTRALPDEVNRLTPINPTGQPVPAPPPSVLLSSPNLYRTLSNAMVLDKVSREMGTTQFRPLRQAPPPNHNFSGAGGGTTYLWGRPLGYFASGSYKHDYWFYEDGISRRYQDGTELKNSYRDSRGLSTVNWSSMVNLAYRPLDDHELGFTFFFNQNATDDARVQDQGYDSYNTGDFRKFNLYWIERNLNTYQMKGKHDFPDVADLQFNWLVALTQTAQYEPDARFFNDVDTGGGYEAGGTAVPSPSKPTRYFRNLDENDRTVKLDWSLPFRNRLAEQEGKFKFGLFDSFSQRTFAERQFYYPGHGGYQDDPNLYLQEGNLGLVSIRTNYSGGKPRSLTFNWGDYVQTFDSLYDGQRSIQAGFLMLDLPVVDKVRLIGGVRYETTDLSVHSESYLDSSVTSTNINDTRLRQSDLLPSAGLIYSLASNMNVRAGFSQTIARPSFRELAAYYSYDTIISDFVEGNPTLLMTGIDNYDLRWEWFPRPGELLGVSLFYKDLTAAIERGNITVEGNVISFRNNDAKLFGIEFEARKNLDFLDANLRHWSIGGNLSLIQSEVKLTPSDLAAKRQFFPDCPDTRPLYDQSPYIVNLDLSYNNPHSGTSATLLFNMAGPRIVITKLNTEDVYDQPVPVLDFFLSQKVGRNTTLRLGLKNLLNPKIERTYGKSSGLLYSSYTRGFGVSVALSHEF